MPKEIITASTPPEKKHGIIGMKAPIAVEMPADNAAVLAKFRLMAFLGSLHPANGDICAGDFIPPAIQSPPDRVFENWGLYTQVSQLFLPPLRMPLLRLGHAQQNALASFVRFLPGKVAIGLRSLDFGAPIA
jgi:hypothetical protein